MKLKFFLCSFILAYGPAASVRSHAVTPFSRSTTACASPGSIVADGGAGAAKSIIADESPPPPEARLSNLSLRATVGPGSQLTAGFVIGAGPNKTVLVRAIGPALAAFGVGDALADPKLELFDETGAKIAENDNAGKDSAAAAVAAGAFPLMVGDKDAALVATLAPGSYTARVTGVDDTRGVALIEAYETTGGDSRLLNLSARAPVGPGDNLLISGFTLAPGSGTRRLLIRAIGGATLGSFGVSDTLGDPILELFSGTAKIAENDNWALPIGGGTADASTLNAAYARSGAFHWLPAVGTPRSW